MISGIPPRASENSTTTSQNLEKRVDVAELSCLSQLFKFIANAMSQHNSFKKGSASALKKRNVLKRFERVELLAKRGQWSDGDRVVGLRKTKPAE